MIAFVDPQSWYHYVALCVVLDKLEIVYVC
jgi:hypothetical protein